MDIKLFCDAAQIVQKGWGYEKVIVNTPDYCGKILHFFKGKKCSFHRHCIKDETFFLNSGSIRLLVGWDEDVTKAKELILKPGDIYHIPVGLCHQMYGVEESDLFEYSTHHEDQDSVRIIKGD